MHPQADRSHVLAVIIANHAQKQNCSFQEHHHYWSKTKPSSVLDDVEDLKSFDGVVVYQCPAVKDDENDLLFGPHNFNGSKSTTQWNCQCHYQPRGASSMFVRDDRLKVLSLWCQSHKRKRPTRTMLSKSWSEAIMSNIVITIDGKRVCCNRRRIRLGVARRNDIFYPCFVLCYQCSYASVSFMLSGYRMVNALQL